MGRLQMNLWTEVVQRLEPSAMQSAALILIAHRTLQEALPPLDASSRTPTLVTWPVVCNAAFSAETALMVRLAAVRWLVCATGLKLASSPVARRNSQQQVIAVLQHAQRSAHAQQPLAQLKPMHAWQMPPAHRSNSVPLAVLVAILIACLHALVQTIWQVQFWVASRPAAVVAWRF